MKNAPYFRGISGWCPTSKAIEKSIVL